MVDTDARRALAAAFDVRANLRALLHPPARQSDHFVPIDGLVVIAVLAVAATIYLALERPLMNLRDLRRARRPTGKTPLAVREAS